jgi:hypothetical protein
VTAVFNTAQGFIHGFRTQSGDNPRTRREWRDVIWTRPPGDTVKINTDGTAKGKPGTASAGGVLRNGSGSWVAGFAHNLGITTSLSAELWAIYQGLRLAKDLGYDDVILEVDSQIAYRALTHGTSHSILGVE